MQRFFTLSILFIVGITQSACSQPNGARFQLQDFYSTNPKLDAQVDLVFDQLKADERVAQMIITSLGKLGKPMNVVEPLVANHKVGGVIFLSGDPGQFMEDIRMLGDMSVGYPLLMSMDAEPSLFNRRLPGTPPMSTTNELKTIEAIEGAVQVIDSTLTNIGFHHNYAPVIDVSPDNEAIGNRTLGSDSTTIIPLANAFIRQTQADQIVATAKHFPGHGRVSGDTHKKLVYIDGELTEVSLYKPVINAGVLSIMVAHVAIENNEKYGTGGMPSTLSPVVVTELLRKELGFEGLIITDAMNMGAVAEIPQSTLLAAKAGCDMILMPPDEEGTISAIMNEMASDPAFKQQVEASIKRVIRLKLCLGMIYGPFTN
ncbi:MAG: glycoside hydrolase family 3 protein [Flavobacteriales bacterium]|nr:glycoside hydrolase family 3 protein [Flavobacteriales bacterium]